MYTNNIFISLPFVKELKELCKVEQSVKNLIIKEKTVIRLIKNYEIH